MNRSVVDAALQIFQRVSFAGGDRQKWVFDLFILYYFFAYLPLQTIPACKFATQHPQPVYSLLKL
jgi:hypothetical protein